MNSSKILGIDLGGTNVRGGLVEGDTVSGIISERINANGSAEEVLQNFFHFTDSLINKNVKAIGIGVPGLVDKGMVYDVVNIPSWTAIPLQSLIEERYNLPVAIN